MPITYGRLAANPPAALANRIIRALEIARLGAYDGAHHKDWVLDQVVRALTGGRPDSDGPVPTFTATGLYEEWRDGSPGWSEGIAP